MPHVITFSTLSKALVFLSVYIFIIHLFIYTFIFSFISLLYFGIVWLHKEKMDGGEFC